MCVGGGFCGSREERFYLFVHHLRTREPFVRLSCHVDQKVTLSLTWRTGCVLWIGERRGGEREERGRERWEKREGKTVERKGERGGDREGWRENVRRDGNELSFSNRKQESQSLPVPQPLTVTLSLSLPLCFFLSPSLPPSLSLSLFPSKFNVTTSIQ